eukprot:snap_masked-scaffold_4-processed-gene-1.8-mRNA-1 protein AED:1.00 eAED:1.00 QI:0/0/0/0/1/1/2/0/117
MVIAQSSREAETIELVRGVSNLKWFTKILNFLRTKFFKIFNDNQGAVKLMLGQEISGRSCHIDLKYFFPEIRYEKNWKHKYIPGLKIFADIMFKPSSKNTIFKQSNKIFKEGVQKEK